jgi:hypothetical protein
MEWIDNGCNKKKPITYFVTIKHVIEHPPIKIPLLEGWILLWGTI